MTKMLAKVFYKISHRSWVLQFWSGRCLFFILMTQFIPWFW